MRVVGWCSSWRWGLWCQVPLWTHEDELSSARLKHPHQQWRVNKLLLYPRHVLRMNWGLFTSISDGGNWTERRLPPEYHICCVFFKCIRVSYCLLVQAKILMCLEPLNETFTGNLKCNAAHKYKKNNNNNNNKKHTIPGLDTKPILGNGLFKIIQWVFYGNFSEWSVWLRWQCYKQKVWERSKTIIIWLGICYRESDARDGLADLFTFI